VNKKSKPLGVVIPDLIKCDVPGCFDGVVTGGLFGHKNPCYKCDGSGKLDKSTGEAVEPKLMVYAQNEEIKKLKTQIEVLKANQKPPPEFDPYGDCSKKDGGTFRMD
jgi:hypothetical protein